MTRCATNNPFLYSNGDSMQQTCGKFAVITLNLRFGLAEDGANGWGFRKKHFPTFFQKYAVDFFCFQEANDFQVRFIEQCLPDYRLVGERSPAPPFWQNNIIFFHRSWHCHHKAHLFLSPTPSIPSRFQDSRWPRQCTIGMFEKGKHSVTCVSTHFDFSAVVQERSARIIIDELSTLPSNMPVILMGDFNTTPSSPCYRLLTGTAPTTRLSSSFKNVFNSPFPGTYHGFSGKQDDRHIDWILYRGHVTPLSQAVITQPFGNQYLSDHFPVIAEFTYR